MNSFRDQCLKEGYLLDDQSVCDEEEKVANGNIVHMHKSELWQVKTEKGWKKWQAKLDAAKEVVALPKEDTKEDAAFYDENMDEMDGVWVNKHLRGGDSDAVLDCPCCFTTICYESQRHASIVTQYRALKVVDCRLVKNSAMKDAMESVYRKVACDHCGTDVGVLDNQHVYHLFNVIPSHV